MERTLRLGNNSGSGVISGIAKTMQYQNMLGLNVLTMVI